MKDRMSRGDVEYAVEQLNVAAKELGLTRRFDMRYGAASAGVSHEILEYHPDLAHPTSTKIGHTFAEATKYVTAMRHALQSAKFDRDYRRGALTGGSGENRLLVSVDPGRTFGVAIHDPDARSETRKDQI